MSHSPGRPVKPDGQKRKQLHISLYGEDIDRLDQLTDNRSEFVRQSISQAWTKHAEEDITFSISLPKSLVHEAFQVMEKRLSPEENEVLKKLMQRFVTAA
ncbi:MAG: hypothetical protein KF832_11090 [Caldilineaceae bacterium]|nr:hypothetical protein [Caldilineaceae bacterium]